MTKAADKKMLFEYLLRLGDNALVLGQQLSKWVGHGPELEEEMAMANFALDYVGQARMFFSYAAEIEGRGRSEDDIAFLRDCGEFRNFLLIEQRNGDFAQTIARQFLFESFYQFQLDGLSRSTDKRIAEIAARVIKEINYHLRHMRQWVLRLGDGTEESHRRLQHAFDYLWRYTGELFEADDIDVWAVQHGVGPNPEELLGRWKDYLENTLKEATLNRPEDGWMDSGGRNGHHTEHLGYLLADMQFLQRAYPGANW
ncbi:MAG: phenylacetate-CoA oxygenase subunit PaaC [Gammaproteobacteria bacterium]|nr:phenylacetate-CoA oxygenase subunit PaaC [Gammaproteobacteria bacterium]